MAEAMGQIRAELGKDAVILNSKVVFSGGFFGFFKKYRVYSQNRPFHFRRFYEKKERQMPLPWEMTDGNPVRWQNCR